MTTGDRLFKIINFVAKVYYWLHRTFYYKIYKNISEFFSTTLLTSYFSILNMFQKYLKS